ncbi:MAG: hypothetical protein JW955_07435 [Sedimentisphaerales bacterium]|nr:hypothetical protein [Sedimentisphaerales bacterium]
MNNGPYSKEQILSAIREAAATLGKPPSRAEFQAHSGITEYHVLKWFPGWNAAVTAAGLKAHTGNIKLDDPVLLEDWGNLVRELRHIPTRAQYRQHGTYSPGVFEKHFGPWSSIPAHFRKFAESNSEWTDVLALLPSPSPQLRRTAPSPAPQATPTVVPVELPESPPVSQTHARLDNRPTYGNPIDFRGLRHEPVNESGVVFLFGIVARELGYYVEAVQAGYPDCEAKRQIAKGKWQRVKIEFEFESRNFRDHGHPPEGCDIIVCWRHNWTECPEHIEVLELSQVIQELAASDD